MAKQISRYMFHRSMRELDKLLENLPRKEEDYKVALTKGDFSENAELDSARSDLMSIKERIAQLEDIKNYEILEYDRSPLITLGSIVEVTSDYLKPENTITLIVEKNGGPLIEGVLSTNSPLGKAILGGTSGTFIINNRDFEVNKVLEPDFDKFNEMYPDDNITIAKLLEEA